MTFSHTATTIGWIAIAVGVVVLSLLPRIPSAVALLRAGARHPPVRVILLLGWAWLGWHFFVRTTR